MTTYPTLYKKNDFIKFLKKINVNEETINKFRAIKPHAINLFIKYWSLNLTYIRDR